MILLETDQYRDIINELPIAYAYHEMKYDADGHPSDYRFLEVNRAFETMTGLSARAIEGQWVTTILPTIRSDSFDWIQYYGDIVKRNEKTEFVQYSKPLDRWYKVQVHCPKPNCFATIFSDISEEIEQIRRQKHYLSVLKGTVLLVDSDQVIRRAFINPSHPGLFTTDRPGGQTLSTAFSSSDLVREIDLSLKKINNGADSFSFEYEDHPSTPEHVYHVEILPETMEHETTVHMIIFKEITEERQMQRQLEIFQSLNLDYFCVLDANGTILTAKTGGTRAFKNTPDAPNTSLVDLVVSEDRPLTKHSLQAAKDTGGIVTFSTRIERRSNNDRHYEWRCCYRDGVFYAAARDMTPNRQAEQQARQLLDEHVLILDNIDVQVWYLKDAETYGRVNQAHADFFGVTKETLENQSLYQILKSEEADQCVVGNHQVFETKQRQHYKEWIVNGAGEPRLLAITKTPVFDCIAHLKYVICSGLDITEQYRAEQQLQSSEKRYRALIESQHDLIVRVTPDNLLTFVNDAYCRTFGKTQEELLGHSFTPFIHEADLATTLKAMENLRVPPHRVRVEQRALTVDGWRWIAWEDYAIRDERGDIIEIQGVGRDITESKMNEERLATSLKEKEVLLKEIHHRVKNNLQVISSLIYLQAQYTQHFEARKSLKDSENRVRALAALHEQIYQSEELTNVDVSAYLRNTIEQLAAYYKPKDVSIQLDLKIEPIPMTIDTAVPFGLMINELITNALEHAFKGRKQGRIELQITQDEAGIVQLLLSDNGLGLPSGFDLSQRNTLGLQLVTSLVKQLKGTLTLEPGPGTTYNIQFPLQLASRGEA